MRPGCVIVDVFLQIAVVITDGAQTVGPGVPLEPLAHIAGRLQSQDITVLAIAIGQDVPRNQLLNLTNSIEENIMQVQTFANLSSVINRFINISCTGVYLEVQWYYAHTVLELLLMSPALESNNTLISLSSLGIPSMEML